MDKQCQDKQCQAHRGRLIVCLKTFKVLTFTARASECDGVGLKGVSDSIMSRRFDWSLSGHSRNASLWLVSESGAYTHGSCINLEVTLVHRPDDGQLQ
jgi:hypothetical protein